MVPLPFGYNMFTFMWLASPRREALKSLLSSLSSILNLTASVMFFNFIKTVGFMGIESYIALTFHVPDDW